MSEVLTPCSVTISDLVVLMVMVTFLLQREQSPLLVDVALLVVVLPRVRLHQGPRQTLDERAAVALESTVPSQFARTFEVNGKQYDYDPDL